MIVHFPFGRYSDTFRTATSSMLAKRYEEFQ